MAQLHLSPYPSQYRTIVIRPDQKASISLLAYKDEFKTMLSESRHNIRVVVLFSSLKLRQKLCIAVFFLDEAYVATFHSWAQSCNYPWMRHYDVSIHKCPALAIESANREIAELGRTGPRPRFVGPFFDAMPPICDMRINSEAVAALKTFYEEVLILPQQLNQVALDLRRVSEEKRAKLDALEFEVKQSYDKPEWFQECQQTLNTLERAFLLIIDKCHQLQNEPLATDEDAQIKLIDEISEISTRASSAWKCMWNCLGSAPA